MQADLFQTVVLLSCLLSNLPGRNAYGLHTPCAPDQSAP